MARTELTLTDFQRVGRERNGRELVWRGFQSREAAENAIWGGDLVRVDEVTHTYRLGDDVRVNAFGAWRPGRVIGLGTSRVIVEYARNRTGTLARRAFTASDIRPAGGEAPTA